MKRVLCLVSSLLLTLFFVGCHTVTPPASDTTPTDPDGTTVTPPETLCLAYNREDTLDPFSASTQLNLCLSSLLYEPLLRPGADFAPVLVLAQSAEQTDSTHITVTLRKAYGGAYIVMSSKHIRGDINYAWPTAEIAVMGASGAVGVLHAKEVAAIENPEERAKFVAEKEQEYNDKFSNPYNAARYGYIDDVIEPRNTRFRIIRALQALSTKRLQNPPKKHSNIPL